MENLCQTHDKDTPIYKPNHLQIEYSSGIFLEENDGSKNIFTAFEVLLRKTALHTKSERVSPEC